MSSPLFHPQSHPTTLPASRFSLNTLRRTRHFCDVVLQVGHADLHAHRAVLASQSRFFYELFSESEESEQKSLPFHYKLGDSFDLEAFESLVNYAYTSRLEISVDKVKAVYKTALVLKVHMLARARPPA